MEFELTNYQQVLSLLKKYGLWAKKELGQNFLIDADILKTIVETPNIQATEHVIEIGPGLGVLTKELSKIAKKVTSIELDPIAIKILKETIEHCKNVKIIHADALHFTPPPTPYKVVANIPYNITSPLIAHFLQTENKPVSMTLLVQKEVGQKICESEKHSTVLSLQTALFADAKLISKVAPSCFFPAPKVESAIIHLVLHNKYTNEEAQKVIKIAKRAFSQKRKKLSNTLPDIKEQLKEFKLASKRPQELTIPNWQKIASI